MSGRVNPLCRLQVSGRVNPVCRFWVSGRVNPLCMLQVSGRVNPVCRFQVSERTTLSIGLSPVVLVARFDTGRQRAPSPQPSGHLQL